MLKKIAEYVENTPGLLFFVLDDSGRVRRLNRGASQLIGSEILGHHFLGIAIDFYHEIELNRLLDAPIKEHLLSVRTRDGKPQSLLFTFVRDDEGILVFGRIDTADIELTNKEVYLLNQQLGNISRELQKKNASLEHALAHIKTLQGIIPICMHCHKIRNEKDVWDRFDAYIESHTEAAFSHCICAECLAKHYPKTIVRKGGK